jgi:ubiquinone/menaquinone biosynthesis C-methylase UbiE
MPSSSNSVNEGVKVAYNDIAQHYTEWTKSSHAVRLSYLDLLLDRLPSTESGKTASVLELGCGAGIPCTEVLAARGNLAVTANDISSAQLAIAAQHIGPSVKFIEQDMMDLEFEDGEFDAVIAMYSIIHLSREQQTVVFRRISRWLKPGGWFLANFGAAEDAGSTDPNWLGAADGIMHWSSWGSEKTPGILRDYGFELEICEVDVDIEDYEEQKNVPFLWVLAKMR